MLVYAELFTSSYKVHGEHLPQPFPQMDNAQFGETESANIQGKKKAKEEALPLKRIYNEKTGRIDKPVSIREVLKHTKLDLLFLDFFNYSPKACTKLRKL